MGKIYAASTRTDEGRYGGQNAYQLGQQFAGSFPSGWSATAYYNSYVYNFNAGNQSHLPSSPGTVDRSLTQYSMDEIQLMIANMLSQEHYVIAGVSLSTKTGFLAPNGIGHFVVVTGSNSEYVYINNPFNNDKQRYTWQDFYKSFQYWVLEIKPPALSPAERKIMQMK